jgi:hypothetical protein
MVVGGLHPKQIGVIALFKTTTFPQCGAPLAQQPLQKAKCRETASNSIRSVEQIGRSHPTALKSSG